MNPIVTKRLHDALKAAKDVHQWTHGQSFDAHMTDPMMRYPVERQLEIIWNGTRPCEAAWPGYP